MDPVNDYLLDLQTELAQLPLSKIYDVICVLQEARSRGAHIFIMGNGGSASTASHFVCDLMKNTRSDGRPAFKVTGLADNMAVVSAFANDEGYENIFAQQLSILVQPNDIVIGISTSGNSMNVIRAIEVANQVGATTIAFTGHQGGQLGAMVDLNICAPSDNIERIEDIHLVLEHMITKVLREEAQGISNLVELSNC
jgi:D-sedoheptulose 7-phosphate isomerase